MYKAIVSMAMLITLAICAQAQSFREYLGPRYFTHWVRTPQYGISVDTGGFEIARPKRLRKSQNYMRSLGLPEYLISGWDGDQNVLSLGEFARRLWTDEAQILRWTDEAWAVKGVGDPSALRITVVSAPFYVPATGQWRTSWAWDANNVSVCIVYVQAVATADHPLPEVRDYRREVMWGIGLAKGTA